MNVTQGELEFLSVWAREEWEPACYQLPAHRLQLANGASAAQLTVFIKAWAEKEGKKDQEILGVAILPQPRWPWSTASDFNGRLAEVSLWRARQHGVKNAAG
jgi:hypothetical protein